MKVIDGFGLAVASARQTATAAAAKLFRSHLLGGSGLPLILMGPTSDPLQRLRDQLQEATSDMEAITQEADDGDRDLTPEELASITELSQKCDNLRTQIAARETIANAAGGGGGRKTAPGGGGGDKRVAPTVKDSARWGFKSMGEFALAVRQASIRPDAMDARLTNVATTYGNEGVGADGGFAVPPEFRREIWTKVMGVENLFSRVTQLVTASNSLTFPKDETTPWDTTKGVQVFWESEAGQIAQSKPALGTESMRLNKLTGLVPISEELLQDAPGIESWLRAKVPTKMAAKLNRAIVRGTGVGQPMGILNSGSLVSVAKEGSQGPDTIWYKNIVNMWSRLAGELRGNSVWLVNQDIEPQLYTMQFAPGSSTPVPVYLPANGVSGSPFATLMGRPVIPVQACSTLGDKGDIILTDLSQYFGLTKGQDIQTDVSMHFFFDQALMAFRFILRITGQPAWGSVITPENGVNTLSWAVTLDERT